MAGWRRVVELAMTCEEIERLTALSRSRTEPASRVHPNSLQRVYLHAQAWFVAQSHRGLLLQIRAVGPAPHPGHLKTRTQRAHYGRHRRRKSPPRHPHLVIQTRRRRLI